MWRKQVSGVTKDYCQGIEYKDGKVEAVYGQEGRLTAVYDEYGVTLTRFRAEYWLKDHLGNTRLAFADDNHNGTIEVWDDPSTPENEAEITQAKRSGVPYRRKEVGKNHYYPFGMNQEGPWYATIGPINGYQYNGKELNEELELDWNDYGARWHDASIGRFTSIDRFATKYYSFSAYSYGANNPIKFIDVNGDSILIQLDKKNVAYYIDGKLYNKDHSEYFGKGVKINKDGTIKLKGFLKSVVNALNNIRTGGSFGNNMVTQLQADTDKFIIRKGSNSTVGRIVNYDPTSTTSGIDETGKNKRPSYIGLAHELAHAIDWDDGSVDISVWITYSDGRTSSNAEKYASHIENQIRAENNIPLREFYGIDQGKGVGRLLIHGTRMSANINIPVWKGFSLPYIYPQ